MNNNERKDWSVVRVLDGLSREQASTMVAEKMNFKEEYALGDSRTACKERYEVYVGAKGTRALGDRGDDFGWGKRLSRIISCHKFSKDEADDIKVRLFNDFKKIAKK